MKCNKDNAATDDDDYYYICLYECIWKYEKYKGWNGPTFVISGEKPDINVIW